MTVAHTLLNCGSVVESLSAPLAIYRKGTQCLVVSLVLLWCPSVVISDYRINMSTVDTENKIQLGLPLLQ